MHKTDMTNGGLIKKAQEYWWAITIVTALLSYGFGTKIIFGGQRVTALEVRTTTVESEVIELKKDNKEYKEALDRKIEMLIVTQCADTSSYLSGDRTMRVFLTCGNLLEKYDLKSK